MKHKMIISFDLGKTNVGIAIGQTITKTATPLTTLKANKWEVNWIEIEKILIEWKPSIIVIGLPLNMNGTMQNTTKKAFNFAKKIYKKFSINFEFQDERLTTIESKEYLFNLGGSKFLNKNINSEAAAIILETWIRKKYIYNIL